jgi:hypothetical protein
MKGHKEQLYAWNFSLFEFVLRRSVYKEPGSLFFKLSGFETASLAKL